MYRTDSDKGLTGTFDARLKVHPTLVKVKTQRIHRALRKGEALKRCWDNLTPMVFKTFSIKKIRKDRVSPFDKFNPIYTDSCHHGQYLPQVAVLDSQPRLFDMPVSVLSTMQHSERSCINSKNVDRKLPATQGAADYRLERVLGDTEASYFLPSRENGVNDM